MHSAQYHHIGLRQELAVISKIRHIVSVTIDSLDRALTAARVAEQNPADSEKIFRILTHD